MEASMAFHVELSSPKNIENAEFPLEKVDSSTPILQGLASLKLDSLDGPEAKQKPAELLNLGNGGTDYRDLNEFVESKLDELQRMPMDYYAERDRHIDVTPFAFNQVCVNGSNRGMNGSWISFPNNDPLVTKLHLPGKYIATSAPVPESFPFFMQMLEQYAVPLVISLTNFTENYSIKADPYLPYEENENIVYGGGIYEVTCTKVHSPIQLSDTWLLERRDFKLILRNSSTAHCFSQWHLPDWKDYSAGAVDAVANLVKYAYAYRKENSILAPIVVHCSGGIGRAGTFINCSECYERWNEKSPVRIFDIAAQSRLQRPGLGGNKAQYEMVYSVFDKLTSS